MQEHPDGTGEFVQVVLKPVVRISPEAIRQRRGPYRGSASFVLYCEIGHFPVEIEPRFWWDDDTSTA